MLDESAGRVSEPEGPAQLQCALLTLTPASQPAPEAAELVDHILTRYHATHRREFPQAIELARKVEAVHADAPDCPHGLACHLTFMADDLDSHQQREEGVLFPMILRGGGPMIRFPVRQMMREHEDVEEQLSQLRRLTRNYATPPGACRTWQALMRACDKLERDLREHMRLENEVLFAPFVD